MIEILGIVKSNLQTRLQEEASAMPKNFNQTRFLQNCLTVLRDVKDIEKCEVDSIVSTLIKGAYLDLDFFMGTCYAIPYNKNIGTRDKPKWIKALQFQTDYKGDMALAKKYSSNNILDIYAKVVKKGDDFNIEIRDGKQFVNFKPLPFNDSEILGAFAVIYYEDGSMSYDSMSKKEILATREAYAKKDKNNKFSKAWQNSEGEMFKKTVLKRACKLVTLSFDNSKQDDAYNESSDIDVTEVIDVTETKVKDPFDLTEKKTEKIENNEDNSLDILTSVKNYLSDLGKSPTLVNKYSSELFNKVSDLLTVEEMKKVEEVIKQEIK